MKQSESADPDKVVMGAPESSTKLYARRDAPNLEPYYSQHVSAMTSEGLHAKADIAAELAFRDKQLSSIEDMLEMWQGPRGEASLPRHFADHLDSVNDELERQKLTSKREPDVEGWWVRHERSAKVMLFRVTFIQETNGPPQLMIWRSEINDFDDVSRYCGPGFSWAGPVELPWEDE